MNHEPVIPLSHPPEMDPIEVKRIKLDVLRREHGDLDGAIMALEAQSSGDAFTIKRLKKKKLHLKDRIRILQDQINPDIIA